MKLILNYLHLTCLRYHFNMKLGFQIVSENFCVSLFSSKPSTYSVHCISHDQCILEVYMPRTQQVQGTKCHFPGWHSPPSSSRYKGWKTCSQRAPEAESARGAGREGAKEQAGRSGRPLDATGECGWLEKQCVGSPDCS